MTYKEHLEQLEIINEDVEVLEMMGHSKAKILRSFRDFEQNIMREQRQQETNYFVHIFCSGDAIVKNGKLELKLLDGKTFSIEAQLETMTCADYTLSWAVFDCGRDVMFNQRSPRGEDLRVVEEDKYELDSDSDEDDSD